jgi:hypothetical protein
MTYVHCLVELSSVDDLPCNFDLVVVEVLLDLVFVDGVNDCLLARNSRRHELVNEAGMRRVHGRWAGE